jgi:hypothetical protein
MMGSTPRQALVRGFGWLVAAGFILVGGAIVASFPDRRLSSFNAWASLAWWLAVISGVVFVYGLDRWFELASLRSVRLRAVAPALGLAALFVIALPFAQRAVAGPPPTTSQQWRGGVLVLLALLGAIPVVTTMFGIRTAAGTEPRRPVDADAETARLISLRWLLQRLLTALGSLVALSTLGLGAWAQLSNQLPIRFATQKQPYTSQDILLFGALGSFLVAIPYVPALSALRAAGLRLCDRLFPPTGNDGADADDVVTRADKRHKLRELLGTDRAAFAELTSSVVIAGPLIAATMATFLPRSR